MLIRSDLRVWHCAGTDLERGLLGWKLSHSVEGGKKVRGNDEQEEKRDDDTNNINDNNINVEFVKINGNTSDESELHHHKGKKRVELTEDEIYGFAPLRNRLSSSLWRFVPFVPPSAIRAHVPAKDKHAAESTT
jgi:hypothetical protein